MKNRLYTIGLLGLLMFGLSWMITSCGSDDELLEGVDLRYEELGKNTMGDYYLVDASGTVTVQMRVKSDHAWRVHGTADWYTVSPSEGEAGEATVVTITCDANTELDDRLDTIKIQSDYWVGKTFALEQKGIAYLTAEAAETGVLKSKELGTASFVVKANQSWSVVVTEGSEWLSIAEHASGGEAKVETETEVTLNFNANLGEERVGKLTIFDRNKNEETKVEVQCTQEGIVLIPVIPAEQQQFGYFRIENAGANQFTIEVESNGDWIASKEDDSDDWYEIVGQTEFSGNGVVTVEMTENETAEVRIANILFQSKQVEGAEVVSKSVTVKQANTPQPIRTTLDAGGIGAWQITEGWEKPVPGEDGATFSAASLSRTDFAPGNFKVSVKDMDNTSIVYMYINYVNPDNPTTLHRLTVGLNDVAKPQHLWTFATPWTFWAPGVSNGVGTVNMTAPHTFGINLENSDGAMHVTYHLDDVDRHDLIANGEARVSPLSGIACNGAYKMSYDAGFEVQILCSGGSATFEWFEYTPNIDWKD